MRFRSRRFRRAMALRPVDATKNYVMIGPSSFATGTVNVITLALGQPASAINETDVNKTYYIEEGASVYRFNLALRVYNPNADKTQASVVIMLRKNERFLEPVPTLGQMSTPGTLTWKNRIFKFFHMNPDGAGGLPLGIDGIKIPKRFATTNLSDAWELIIANNSTGNINVCGFVEYKWFK